MSKALGSNEIARVGMGSVFPALMGARALVLGMTGGFSPEDFNLSTAAMNLDASSEVISNVELLPVIPLA